MAERVRVALYGDDDGFEDWLEDAMISWFPTFERYQMSFDVDPNDDNFVALEEEVRRVIHEEIRKRIGPLMMKILKTGDWHDATPPEQEN